MAVGDVFIHTKPAEAVMFKLYVFVNKIFV